MSFLVRFRTDNASLTIYFPCCTASENLSLVSTVTLCLSNNLNCFEFTSGKNLTLLYGDYIFDNLISLDMCNLHNFCLIFYC
jgi:hypothetical protein